MRSTFFLSLLIVSATACAAEEPPVRQLQSYYQVTLEQEVGSCHGRDANYGIVGPAELSVDASSDASSDAVDMRLFIEDWRFDFEGVYVLEDGSFEGWSLYAFVQQDGTVSPPYFQVLEGSATQYGLEATFTEYYTDGDDNDSATPSCRFVWRVTDR